MITSKKIRVAVGGLLHETNTYATELTGPTNLEDLVVYSKEEMLKLKGTAMGGPIEECLENGWEIVPTVFRHVNTTFGMVSDEAYASVKEEIISILANEKPIDIFYLMIHGAGVVLNTADLEGDLAKSIREAIGPKAKIVSSTDLHGKVTDLIAKEYDFYTTCKEYAHVDLNPCAKDALRHGVQIFLGEITPIFRYKKIPILLPPSTTMLEGAFGAQIKEKCLQYELNEKVLNCSVMHGFPYQDTDFCGMYVLVTTNNDSELAESISDELAQWIWDNREQTLKLPPSVKETVAEVFELLDKKGIYSTFTAEQRKVHKPIVIADIGDNPGGGCTGDTTHLLREIMLQKACKIAFFNIRDEETVNQAIASGVGTTIDVQLGAKLDKLRGGAPIVCKAYVKSISDGIETIRGPMVHGMTFNLGPSVRLIIGEIDVIVQKGLGQALDDVTGRAHGVIVEEYDIVCVKSSAHFRAFYKEISDDIFMADSPGLTTTDVCVFEHKNLSYPIFPLHDNASYPIA
jgi:microcystin degradation protein MlrC